MLSFIERKKKSIFKNILYTYNHQHYHYSLIQQVKSFNKHLILYFLKKKSSQCLIIVPLFHTNLKKSA